MARSRIQRRLLISHLLLLLGALLPAVVLLERLLGEEGRDRVREALLREASALASEYVRAPPSDVPAWTATVDAGARVTVIALGGRVEGDSGVPTARLAEVENHAHRPEVEAAFAGHKGSDVRRSATVGAEMMYVAVPLGSPPRAVLRLALPLDEVGRTVERAQVAVWWAGLVAVGFAVLLGSLLARRLGRPLLAMTEAARAMTRGDFALPLPPPSEDELGDLVHALAILRRQLAGRLEDLRREGEKLRSILDGMTEGVALVQEGRITVANPAFATLLGAARVEGCTPLEAARLPDLAAAIEAAVTGGTGTACALEVQGRALEMKALPLGERGLRQAVVVLLDVTDARRGERMRRDFVANASHELRTPVAAVLAAADTLQAGAGDDPEARDSFLAILVRHAHRLSRLTGDLLDLSRLEAGYRPRIEAVAVGAALDTVLAALGPRADEKAIAVQAALPPGLPAVAAERAALEQVLANLLDNAIKYTPDGGRVEVTASANEREVAVTVADSGPGIPSEHLPRLFERFYRVDSARSRELGGTGLGLAIASHLALAHGGDVSVESTPGSGARFTVRLPRA
ncbi:MAG: HAMP domain-containing histidine kinase [Myxococcales bacterium]|nr:HAMP domain-containing histidine kinase [Myxococcales bacterium]